MVTDICAGGVKSCLCIKCTNLFMIHFRAPCTNAVLCAGSRRYFLRCDNLAGRMGAEKDNAKHNEWSRHG